MDGVKVIVILAIAGWTFADSKKTKIGSPIIWFILGILTVGLSSLYYLYKKSTSPKQNQEFQQQNPPTQPLSKKEEKEAPVAIKNQQIKQEDPVLMMKKLFDLKEAGFITEEEFEEKKANLLNKI